MKDIKLSLFIEINSSNIIFYAGECNEYMNFKIILKNEIPIVGIENNRVTDFDKVFNLIKENIFSIEHKINHTFKEVFLIIENFDPNFINISGYKKLNGSQILRENITYILNTLKSYVHEIENKKDILHIFNSNFYLDSKKIENLPIGLFGDFYSHELSFNLINTNDYKNLKNVFEKCNLKIKKILLKSFVQGSFLSENKEKADTFFYIKMNENNSKIFYFENNSLKFEQHFDFGESIILKDISKIISFNIDKVKIIINKIDFTNENINGELLEEEFFNGENYRKIKKKLIYDISMARIKEISELIIFKNINFLHYNKTPKKIYLELSSEKKFKSLNEIYKFAFSFNGFHEFRLLDSISNEEILSTAFKLVHFGWKKEAIPVTQSKKSILARFFEAIFG